jgi:predicted Ser/Thr protein kinase
MIACPTCASQVSEASRFCSSCGGPLDPASLATRTALGPPFAFRPGAAGGVPPGAATADSPTLFSRSRSVARGVAGLASSDSIHEGRFIPGTMLAGRYRLVGLLGRGGMGEVYRAEDLKLGQQVALKFMPEALAADPGRLERFLNEVRIARQISHPNVCRVYDIGEIEGQHYLSMEYVDGEDLSSLLRRIGRLPSDKVVEIARQLCAGLAAAHERGILHRDLKPANVMLDGRGKVRVTDFGLAALAGEIHGGEVRVGTPAYMSPEQLAGKEVTVRSDIYALGLVLYEALTGKTPFMADTLAELVRMHETSTPTNPSSVVGDLDPAVERVILRCLEKDPSQRPASALAVAAALPGGDPLAAALAAGETPSPDMVAAAGEVGALRPAAAFACLAAIVAGFVLTGLLTSKAFLVGRVPLEKPPQVLQERAREVIAKLGYDDPAADTAARFATDQDYLTWVKKNDTSSKRWDGLETGRPPAIFYWYRQSPRPMEPLDVDGSVRLNDPPMEVSGMKTVVLDVRGRLVSFQSVPPQVDETKGPPPAPEWGPILAEAGLDPSKLTPADPAWLPPVFSDARSAWEGSYPDRPEIKIRVEAAAYRGKPVYFDTLGAWSRPERMKPFEQGKALQVGVVINIILVVCVLVGAVLLARRNLRLGRGDRRGAFRVALFILGSILGATLLDASHGPTLAREWSLFINSFGVSMFFAGMVWILYIALEPHIRRRWPDSIISWNRLLAGRLRDPLIGRDILIGGALGIALALIGRGWQLLPALIGHPPPVPAAGMLVALLGARFVAFGLLVTQLNAVISSMFLLFFLTLGRLSARGHWSAVAIFFVILTVLTALIKGSGDVMIDLACSAALAGILTVAFVRFGLLTGIAAQFFGGYAIPITFDFSQWYAGACTLGLAALLALAAAAFYTSLGGRPLLGGTLLED